ncbi:Rapid ALkalinization Factor [Trema orientale]|uniref:Rapid ALkalinization Factor n=1 Tax=Trema orientale TaxID=63057 RepID=A0A2P5CE55_TREOI|nr:Rapid ALkalinization Factor [Trema orientale]
MKAWLVCLILLISVAILSHTVPATEAGETKRANKEWKMIHPGVMDPCKRPGGLRPPGCHDLNERRAQANVYTRGCTQTDRCRSGNPPRRSGH